MKPYERALVAVVFVLGLVLFVVSVKRALLLEEGRLYEMVR